MQEQLLGYLLGALEDDERREVEQTLQRQPHLQDELQNLEDCLRLLEAGREPFDPPPQLAEKTCQALAELAAPSAGPNPGKAIKLKAVAAAIAETSTAEATKTPGSLSPTHEAPSGANRWSLSDLSVAGGVFLAAGLLLLPAIEHSRFVAQRTVCQNNLRQIGQAAIDYTQQPDGLFPLIETEGNLSVAGVFPLRLIDGGYLEDATSLMCPSSAQSNDSQNQVVDGQRGQPRVVFPTIEQLRAERDLRKILCWQRVIGGDYAYTLGHMEGAQYFGTKNKNRKHFPIAVDRPIVRSRYTLDSNAPSIQLAGDRSANHGGHGQNVLYEDGHVEWMSDCFASGFFEGADRVDYPYHDNFFKNDDGDVAAGRHADDAACGSSDARPIPPYILRWRVDR